MCTCDGSGLGLCGCARRVWVCSGSVRVCNRLVHTYDGFVPMYNESVHVCDGSVRVRWVVGVRWVCGCVCSGFVWVCKGSVHV